MRVMEGSNGHLLLLHVTQACTNPYTHTLRQRANTQRKKASFQSAPTAPCWPQCLTTNPSPVESLKECDLHEDRSTNLSLRLATHVDWCTNTNLSLRLAVDPQVNQSCLGSALTLQGSWRKEKGLETHRKRRKIAESRKA